MGEAMVSLDMGTLDRIYVIDDEFRIHYLSAHLRAVMQAIDNGSRVEGFFVW
jgi:beta-glucosidase/6-phospho-beta-glucosidase/beta-galactosidase